MGLMIAQTNIPVMPQLELAFVIQDFKEIYVEVKPFFN